MFAIKVVLQPDRQAASGTAQQLCDMASERIRCDAQPGVEHVSLVASPPLLMAMTFVVAISLLEAEKLAAAAWTEWLDRIWFGGWRIASCTADLALAVWAVSEAPFQPDDGGFEVG
ncbi:hypothetical protein [Streptomyces sp. SID12501]|uniref:Uncharacterized protein n=1 Tax=Streptomyces sp. SID12501 TaxID=2706042 RepID=A0A6B3BVG6_9ACTN|nr:hypothetical protein [Streptomyces sp. SID12501]NEC88373.1 hypothetical protein [Streptomyces sp. SID12501]